MGVDEAWHGAQAFDVDDLSGGRRRSASSHGNDPSAADDDRPALDDGAVAGDDAGVDQREVLSRQRCCRAQNENDETCEAAGVRHRYHPAGSID
jgi:hypothetical protein